MKTKIYSFLVLLVVSLSACNSKQEVDKCAEVPCPFECQNGECICPLGYSGTLCEDIWAKNYVGLWLMTTDGSITEHVVINSATTDLSVLLFNDFWDTNNVPAKFTSKYEFKFYENHRLADGYTLVSGEGKLNELGTQITGTYTIMNNSNVSVSFEFVMDKM